jgi:hypothetical protein
MQANCAPTPEQADLFLTISLLFEIGYNSNSHEINANRYTF